jgi:hypothetical protein
MHVANGLTGSYGVMAASASILARVAVVLSLPNRKLALLKYQYFMLSVSLEFA